MVGAAGFEPATPWSQARCSTKLSHAPLITRVIITFLSCPCQLFIENILFPINFAFLKLAVVELCTQLLLTDINYNNIILTLCQETLVLH